MDHQYKLKFEMKKISYLSSLQKKTTNDTLDYFFNKWDIDSIILKTTNICTFKCKYCFWFRKKEGDRFSRCIRGKY